MPFELPKLPYAIDALQPYLSGQTLGFHHGKHHQTYLNNLNSLLPGTRFENSPIEEIVRESEGAIFNNSAQVWNHTFYFLSFSPSGAHQPKNGMSGAIDLAFGSFEKFKEEFTRLAVSLFGSGWAWLVKKPDGRLDIVQEPNAGNPIRRGITPLLACDVWEHAYYLDYQNRRPDYMKSFWQILDWDIISSRY